MEFGETVLEIKGNKEQNLSWEGYGFNVTIPEGAVGKGVTVQLAVKALLSSQFDLPDDVHLVSAFYLVSASQPLRKEVLLHVSHFASVDSEEEASDYAFLVGKHCQEAFPYTFKFMGGNVLPHFQHATISMKEFSYTCIGLIYKGNERAKKVYDFRYYLTHVQPHEWVVSYVVTNWLSPKFEVRVDGSI